MDFTQRDIYTSYTYIRPIGSLLRGRNELLKATREAHTTGMLHCHCDNGGVWFITGSSGYVEWVTMEEIGEKRK